MLRLLDCQSLVLVQCWLDSCLCVSKNKLPGKESKYEEWQITNMHQAQFGPSAIMFSMLRRRGDSGNVLYSYDARGTSYIFQRLFRMCILF